MFNMIITLLSNHLLSVIESSLIAAEPELVDSIEKELSLLITKLESFIQSKSPAVSAVVKPILNSANTVADATIEAAGNAALSQAN
jgi:hypothetical protein